MEYKALIIRLQLAKEVGAQTLNIKSNSQLVLAQVYEVKEPVLVKYVQLPKGLLEDFDYNL